MTFIYFILILGVTIFIHELGHFIFAKKAGVYVYEFALGMGPRLFSFKRTNDETVYALRLIPLGGFVQLAGEEIKDDQSVPEHQKLQNKTFGERFLIMVSGVMFNFLLAIVLLLTIGFIYGAPETKPIIGDLPTDFPAYTAGIRTGDKITKINNKRVYTWDDILLDIELAKTGSALTIEVIKPNGKAEQFQVNPVLVEVDGETAYKYGITMTNKTNHSWGAVLKFAGVKFITVINSMIKVLYNLVVGNLSFNNLAGPVGIYNIVDQEVSNGLMNALYLVGFLSINVGFINILPIPAFDGGRLLFLFIEKIKGAPINARTENIIHGIGFILLLILMLVVTLQDIKRLLF